MHWKLPQILRLKFIENQLVFCARNLLKIRSFFSARNALKINSFSMREIHWKEFVFNTRNTLKISTFSMLEIFWNSVRFLCLKSSEKYLKFLARYLLEITSNYRLKIYWKLPQILRLKFMKISSFLWQKYIQNHGLEIHLKWDNFLTEINCFSRQ